jgi:hypothetical protein
LSGVRDGLRVLVFEQTADALEKRLGFRVVEYGLRHVFRRIPDHPVLAGVDDPHLRDWRGEATLTPPRLEYEPSSRYGGTPSVRWCGLEVPRLWRCGNRGNVASVSIEKPARGDFLPIVDGGFSLQYSPLLEFREGRGMVLFCQLDVAGRTEFEPVADRLVKNLLDYVSSWQPPARRRAVYVGEPQGREYLQLSGIPTEPYRGGPLADDQVLIVAPDGSAVLAEHLPAVTRWLDAGGHLLGLELDADEANSFLASKVRTTRREHLAAFFDPPVRDDPLAGIGPADVHNRDPRELPLVTGGAQTVGNGVLARQAGANVVFCQLVPYRVTRSLGVGPSLTVCDREALEGRHSAVLTLGTVPWAQFGQKVQAGQVGKTYTLAVHAKSLGNPAEPVAVRLEVEPAGRSPDRLARSRELSVGTESWTELHLTFQVDKPSPEGWNAYLHCGQEGSRLRVDRFRLVEGPYSPDSQDGAAARDNLMHNPNFEEGTEPWFFRWPMEQQNLRRTYRRTSFLLTRLLANLGVHADTPLLSRFAVPVGGATGDSTVRNGDFAQSESGSAPDHWQLIAESKAASWQLETEESEPGRRVLRIERPASGTESGNERTSVMVAQHDVPVQAEQWYRIRLLAKADGLSGDGVTLALQNTQNWRSLFDYQRFAPGETWREFTFLVQANATAESRTRLQIWHSSPGTLWLAQLSMTPCDPPTQGRWLDGLYADPPQEWDDPYRFFRW